MNRARRLAPWRALLLALLVLPSLATSTTATHALDQDATLPPGPTIPESPVPEPGIPPVDRRLQEISQTLHTVNETAISSYETIDQTYEGLDASRPSQPLQVFFDGTGTTETGADASIGGRGDWSVIGTDTWRRGAKAAHRGQSGFTSATLADGTYLGGAHSMLLSPALDLRSGFADPTFRASYTLLAPLFTQLNEASESNPTGLSTEDALAEAHTSSEDLFSISGVYAALWYNLEHQVLNPPNNNLCGGVPCWQTGIHADNPGDALYEFDFYSRSNLADGEDVVRAYVFTGSERPKVAPTPETCDAMVAPSCTRVTPIEGYGRAGPPSFADGASGFSGSTDWQQYHLDLTHWAESAKPVWVGFVVDTESYASSKRFQNQALFSPSSRFFGFELDDLRLTVPSPPWSVRVRPIHEPSFRANGPDPAVPVNEPFLTAADIVNTGQREIQVAPILEVRGALNRTLVFREALPPTTLPSGSILHVERVVPALEEGSYVIRLAANRLAAPERKVSTQEADSTDDVATLVIQVQQVSNLAFGRLAAAERAIERGDTQTFTLEVSNVGTLDAPVGLLADVVNVQDRTLLPDSAGMLPINEQFQQLTVPAQGSATFTWHVKGSQIGQFALFVREQDAPPFEPGDLDDPFLAPIRPQYRDAELALPAPDDDLEESELNWLGAPRVPIPHSNPQVQAYLQAINTEDTLFLSVVHHNVCAPGCIDFGGVVAAYFDDAADAVATHNGEDGFQNGPTLQHQHWNGTAATWENDTHAVGWIRNYTDNLAARTRNVFALPINATVAGGLTSGVGDAIGMALTLRAGSAPYRFPQGAMETDGAGFVPANQQLSDEMSAWRRIQLQDEAIPPSLAARFLSSGFGVERGPAPIYQADFSNCASTAGWSEVGRTTGANVDAWNCAVYEPDGQVRVFSGRRPGTCIEAADCPPYTVAGTSFFDNGNPGAPLPGQLITPPITIDADSAPFLSIYHQYSSEMLIDDARLGKGRNFVVVQKMDVAVQTWDPETNSWKAPVLLEPLGGYDTEQSAGIYDPLAGPRQVYARNDGPEFFPNCHSIVGTSNGVLTAPNPRCGWFSPTGVQPFQIVTGNPVEGKVYQGSPWVHSVVPLFGAPFGDASVVDVSGKTIRLVFTNSRTGGPDPLYPNEPVPDLGWRIGGITISDEGLHSRDLAVRGLDIGEMPYDAKTLGLGPGTPITINVTITNAGRLDEPRPNVVVRASDVDTGSLLCQTFIALTTPLAAGESRNVTLACALPEGSGGVARFSAAVGGTAADDFPPDNIRVDPTGYAIRPVHNLAVSLDSSAKAGRARSDRVLDLVVMNNGNQPLTDFVVRRTIAAKSDGADEELLESRAWRFLGTLKVGERRSMLDPALEPSTPIDEAHTHFTPPLPGTYEVIARADADADSEPLDDVARMLLTADLQLYLDDFDHARQSDPGIVAPGAVPTTPDGQWANAPVGNLGTKALLAGDEATGELPAGTDASYVLPPFDLATAKTASLTLTHRYELEASYDGGRVEISTNGGQTWRPLVPTPNPLAGRPDGYPDLPVVGVNPLTGGNADGPSLAFTGSSTDFPDAVDGWTKLTFDLAQDPAMRRAAEFDAFDLAEFEPSATSIATRDGIVEVRSPSWELDEPGALSNDRYWWILNQPAPVSGDRMWWSGSVGTAPITDPIDNTLRLTLPTPQPNGLDARPLWLRWWDWRTGAEDSAGPLGVAGGDLSMRVLESDQDSDGLPDGLENATVGLDWKDPDTDEDGFRDGTEVHSGTDPVSASSVPTPRLTERDPVTQEYLTEEWVARMAGLAQLDLHAGTDHDGDGLRTYEEMLWGTLPRDSDTDDDGTNDGNEVNARHTNPLAPPTIYTDLVRDDGWTLHRTDASRSWGHVVAEFDYRSDTTTRADIEANRGVFLDAAQAIQGDVDEHGTLITSTPTTDVHGVEENEPAVWEPITRSGAAWSVLRAGSVVTEPGWSVAEPTTVPGGGPSRPWRFASNNIQGYPHNMDARLVTPVIDLTVANGNDATLRFDHRYQFETTTTENSRACVNNCFPIAVDGGAIEYQVQDTATGAFGPWIQLGPHPDALADGLRFLRNPRQPDHPANSPLGAEWFFSATDKQRFDATGYTALELRDRGDLGTTKCALPPRSQGRTVGHGYTFERFTGFMSKSIDVALGESFCPRLERPYSLVFSGDSGGWQHEEWQIPQLAGKKVRFAFHAASNPGFVNTGTPLLGWEVANVAVAGSVFQGKQAQIRFRVGTDASITKGSWAIDDVSLVGDLYQRLAVIEPSSERNTRAVPGTFIDLYANITNFGRDARNNLAFAVGGVAAADIQIVQPAATAGTIPTTQLPDGFTDGFGPLEAFPGGQVGSRIPVHLRVRAPASGSETAVRVALLEEVGNVYVTPQNDIPGTTADVWRVEGFSQTVLTPIPPDPANTVLLVQQPSIPELGSQLTFTSRVRNDGTTTPVVAAAWTIDEIERKGDPAIQQKTEEIKTEHARVTNDLGALAPDATKVTTTTFTPTTAGLYRVTIRYLADTQPTGQPVQFEFLVGMEGSFHRVDFGSNDETKAAWTDQSRPPEETYGGSVDEIRFRQSGGQFIWGVSDEQLRDGADYCTFGGCNYGVGTSVRDVTGLEGIATSPMVDLGRVPQGEAILSINHGYAFNSPGDGARLEAIPYDPRTIDGPNPAPAFFCRDPEGNQVPQSFILQPETAMPSTASSLASAMLPPQGEGNDAEGATFFVPRRWNALAGEPPVSVPAFGGAPVLQRTDRYLLSQRPEPACADPIVDVPDGFSLVNYPVRFVLHVGTQPGATFPGYQRLGSQGWRINALSVSSSGVSVSPQDLQFPLIDGTPKEFQLRVTNDGQIADRIRVTIDESRSTLPELSWVSIPDAEVELGPRQSALVPYSIEIPTTAAVSRGTYFVALIAQSELDPNVFASSLQRILLRPNPLPDLSVSLSLGSGNIAGELEEGTVVPVFATVFNVGEADAASVRLRVSATDLSDDSGLEIGSATVPPLCAPARSRSGLCSGPTTVSLVVEWSTPLKPGPYNLTVEIDPDGRLIENEITNNVGTMPLIVTPVRRPDVAVVGIDIDAGADGVADEGELIKVTARIANLGAETAGGVNVQVVMGATQLLDRRVDAIPTNVVVNLSASLLATRGEFVLKAIAFADGQAGSDPNPTNNEFKRILRVRGHDLSSGPTTNITGSPGETVATRLAIANNGNTLERVIGHVDPEAAKVGWKVGLAPLPMIIPPGATGDINVAVEVPQDVPAGVHRVPVSFVEQRTGLPLVDAILMVRVLRLAAAPEILLENVSLAPGTHTIPFVVGSRSNFHENITLRMIEPAWGDKTNKTRLPAAQNVTVPMKIYIPPTTPPRIYNVTVEGIGEGGKVVNRTVVNLTVLPSLKPSFALLRAQRTDSAEPGSHLLRLAFDVRNDGNMPFAFRLLPPSLGNTPSQPFVDDEPVDAGTTRRVNWTLTILSSTAIATLEPIQALVGTDGNQTTLASLLPIPEGSSLPNLVLDEPIVQGPIEPTPGDRLRVEVPVANAGAAATAPGRLLAYVDGILVDVADVPPLDPNEETAVVFDWVAPGAGDHLLLFVLEGHEDALESTSADNSASVALSVAKAPLPDKIAHMVPAPGIVIGAIIVAMVALLVRRRREN